MCALCATYPPFNTYARIMKARFKYEIAMAAGMSANTFRRWLANHTDRLAKMGISTRQQLLPPKAVKYICYELGIHDEDF